MGRVHSRAPAVFRLSGVVQKSGQGDQREAKSSEYLLRGRFTRLRFVLVFKILCRLLNPTTWNRMKLLFGDCDGAL
jgi:hypothetical protein